MGKSVLSSKQKFFLLVHTFLSVKDGTGLFPSIGEVIRYHYTILIFSGECLTWAILSGGGGSQSNENGGAHDNNASESHKFITLYVL